MRHEQSGFLRATIPGRTNRTSGSGRFRDLQMASSLITTECKRYGCMKNLLACFANCRYNTRCDELKNELADKTELATRDINQYLLERGRKPIVIQTMKRGVRFVEAAKTAKAKPVVKPKPEPSQPQHRLRLVSAKAAPVVRQRSIAKPKPAGQSAAKAAPVVKRRKKVTMPKRVKNDAIGSRVDKPVANLQPVQLSEAASGKLTPVKPSRAKPKNGSRKSRGAGQRRKVYIIIEGKSATVVNEQGLMQHLFNNPAGGARYFEASEVEARVQIVLK